MSIGSFLYDPYIKELYDILRLKNFGQSDFKFDPGGQSGTCNIRYTGKKNEIFFSATVSHCFGFLAHNKLRIC